MDRSTPKSENTASPPSTTSPKLVEFALPATPQQLKTPSPAVSPTESKNLLEVVGETQQDIPVSISQLSQQEEYMSPIPLGIMGPSDQSYYTGYPQGYPGEESVYGPLPGELHHQSIPHKYNTPPTSPPALCPPAISPRATRTRDAMKTRSGRESSKTRSPLQTVLTRTDRVTKSTGKKAKAKPKPKSKATRISSFKIGSPLSEMSKTLSVSVFDIGVYVQRSMEVREQELNTGKNPGKVKRPMNAFMLYRKAYQNVAKHVCTHNNHQVVSQVCGDSWPMESTQVRDQFNEWAKNEKDNHHLAHPDYKFNPAKPRSAKALKRQMTESDDEGSDLDNYEWGSNDHGNPSISRRAGTVDSDEEYKPPRSQANRHNSSLRRANAGNPAATQYYQPAALQNGQSWEHSDIYNPPASYPHFTQASEDMVSRALESPTPNQRMAAPYGTKSFSGNGAYPDPTYPDQASRVEYQYAAPNDPYSMQAYPYAPIQNYPYHMPDSQYLPPTGDVYPDSQYTAPPGDTYPLMEEMYLMPDGQYQAPLGDTYPLIDDQYPAPQADQYPSLDEPSQ